MKLVEGIKLKGRPAEIPDCSRDDLPQFFVEMGFKVGAEIGVYKGGYTEILGRSGLEIYGVDAWKKYQDYGDRWTQTKFDECYQITLDRLAHYPNVKIIKKTSMEAVEDFPDESLDFVYIDGNHSFRYIADDLYEWVKKIRRGGIVSGHDYAYVRPPLLCGNCHVHQIVDAYISSFGIKNFWVLGRKNHIHNEKRDRWRSWMFIKP